MLTSLFNNSSLPLLEKVAAFTERRQEVLAGNIANVSTPDYRMRDLPVADFQHALQQAAQRLADPAKNHRTTVGAGGERAGQSSISPGLAPSDIADLFPRELFHATESAPKGITFQDGNNRQIEQEVSQMTQNSLLQSIAIELMSLQMNQLQAVISERT